MEMIDFVEETTSALVSNKARSGLTILGIVIGIASVIAMLAVGQGAQSSVSSSVASVGSNLLTIRSGAERTPGSLVRSSQGSAKSLKESDAEALKGLDTVAAVSPEVTGRYQVTGNDNNTNTSIYGVTNEYATVKSIETTEGDFISDADEESGTKVAVLGPTARDDLFGEDATDVVGQTIRINKISFTVIGVTKAKGGTGMGSSDDIIFIPLSTAQKLLVGNQYLTTIEVSVKSADQMDAAQTEITELLMELHGLTADDTMDFSIMNMSDMTEAASSIASVFTILLGSVAGISLVVGGIGIMNMMLTNVTERTREIGLRKAIGAKGKDISTQFLIEAITLTIIGGVVGVLIGMLIAWGLTFFGIMQAEVTSTSVLLACGVSALIGIVFGYYPAKSAARLNPIDALRFE